MWTEMAARKSGITLAASSPQADQLAEHLADLRRGGEITRGTERIACRVISVPGMREAKSHVLHHGHRPGDLDAPPNFGLEREDAVGHHVRRAGSRRKATAINAMPASINGNDSSVPMVSPPQRKPI